MASPGSSRTSCSGSAPGPRVLVGGCVELDGAGIPFAPLVDMLRALGRDVPAEELDELLGSARAEIGRLIPELDDGGAVGAGGRDASRMLELMLGVIGRLAAERPLLLVFEDVQWADRRRSICSGCSSPAAVAD